MIILYFIILPTMKVVKRDGKNCDMHFDEVTARVAALTYDLEKDTINAFKVAQKVFQSMYDGIQTADIDKLAAEVCISQPAPRSLARGPRTS